MLLFIHFLFSATFLSVHKFGNLCLFKTRNTFFWCAGGAVIRRSRQLVGGQLGTLGKLLNLTGSQVPRLSDEEAMTISQNRSGN